MANHEWSLQQLTAKAEAYCAAAEHCISEVQNKLHQWQASAEQCDSIIEHLVKNRYINEQRYCHAFAHDKVLYQGWGRMKILAHLNAKHLPSEAINQALYEIDKKEYYNTLKRVVVSKKRTFKSSDTMVREKLIRFCMQRGFTYDEIEQVLDN
ncbi:MAG: RecX family transcriptional regulator [Paludibacteraceae bacterium]|nr:RecX family transcriptional regulator [Paludibacteraceae bacterium]